MDTGAENHYTKLHCFDRTLYYEHMHGKMSCDRNTEADDTTEGLLSQEHRSGSRRCIHSMISDIQNNEKCEDIRGSNSMRRTVGTMRRVEE